MEKWVFVELAFENAMLYTQKKHIPPHFFLYNFTRYAVKINENQLLDKLWTPTQTIRVTRGQILAQHNSRLCPREIFKLQERMRDRFGNNVTGGISLQSNGYRVPCKS